MAAAEFFQESSELYFLYLRIHTGLTSRREMGIQSSQGPIGGWGGFI